MANEFIARKGLISLGNISSSNTITASLFTGNGLSIDGPSNSHVEVGTYNVGFDIAGTNTLFITGSGLIVSGAMADQNHHNMLKIGDIELIDVNTALSSNEFLIHNVKSISFTSGSDGGNITTANKLFEHTGTQFDIFVGGLTTSDFQVGTANIKVGGTTATQDIQIQTSGDISLLSNTDVFLRIKDSNLTTDPSDLSHIIAFNDNPDLASGKSVKKIEASKIVFTTGSRSISGSLTIEGNISASGNLEVTTNKLVKTSNTDHSYQGDVVFFGGTTSMTQGNLYYFNSSGNWVQADADAEASSGGCLLAIALGAASDTNGMLLRGIYTMDASAIDGSEATGDELYVSTTAGNVTNTAPSGNGDIVRIIGYCLDGTNGQIWFNPSNDFIEITA